MNVTMLLKPDLAPGGAAETLVVVERNAEVPMTYRFFFFLVCLISLHAAALHAQRAPISWGDIPAEHLAMDHYAPDSNAAAVILADYGNVWFNDDGQMIFERHTRIKILSEAGYDYGTVTIPYYAKGRAQRVKDLKGRTYVPGGETHDMGKKSIFHEDINGDWKRVRFTLPALEPGAVIEYRYTLHSETGRYLPDWAFQKNEPVLWSEYRAKIPEIYRYVSVYQGALQPEVVEQKPYSERMQWTITVRPDAFDARGRETWRLATDVEGFAHRWVMKDVPALREEPYMTTPEDYRAKIRFQLAEIGQPSSGTVEVSTREGTFTIPVTQLPTTKFMTTWEQLAEELMESELFGRKLKKNRAVRQQAEALVEGIEDPVARMQAVYDYLRTTMVWNNQRTVLAEQKLDKALTARSADSAEMALLLVSMLRAVGVEAHPVIISTRRHGRIVPLYPMLSQFNSVLAAALIDEQIYLLDATDPLRPHTLLPPEALNGSGFLVREANPGWVALKAKERYVRQSFLAAQLDASGTLTAMLQTSDKGYSALRKRQLLEEADSPEAFFETNVLSSFADLAIDSCAVADEAVDKPLKGKASFSAPGYAQVAGDFIYLNAMPIGRLGENPLRLKERTFPVDVIYPRTSMHTVQLTLPEGYTVQEAPENIRMTVPSGDALFQRMVQLREGVLTVQTKFDIKKAVFEPEDYAALRSFYDQVVAAGAEQVVLKRVETVAGGGEN